MTVTARGRGKQRRLLGFLAGASAVLAIACSPSASTPGMRAALTPAPPAAGRDSLAGSVMPPLPCGSLGKTGNLGLEIGELASG